MDILGMQERKRDERTEENKEWLVLAQGNDELGETDDRGQVKHCIKKQNYWMRLRILPNLGWERVTEEERRC